MPNTPAPSVPLEIRVRATSTRLLLATLGSAIGAAVWLDAGHAGRVDPVRLGLGMLAATLALGATLMVESRRIVLDPRTRTIAIERRRLLSVRRQAVSFDGAHVAYRVDRSGRSDSPRARPTHQPLLRWPGGEVPLSNQHSIDRADFAELERAVAAVLAAGQGGVTAR